ncbi:MAG: class I SAM-dependent methyltransferase [bacterium]|nr:class I SAM-dependent methyltransferase [bacterium]
MNIYGVPTSLVVRWILERENVRGWLDVACGDGRFLEQIGFTPKEGLGIDICENPMLPCGFEFEHADVVTWTTDKYFDFVSMFQIVEYLPKDESMKLITKYLFMAKSILIGTPSGFMREDNENPYLSHRCGFTPQEFEDMGFLVFSFKNYHLRPDLTPKSYDDLLAYRGTIDHGKLKRTVFIRSVAYNLNPLHLYRTLRQYKRHYIIQRAH